MNRKTATNTFHGCLTRKKYMHENSRTVYTHFTVCTIFVCHCFYPLPCEKIHLCFTNLPLLLRNNTKHEKSVLWSNMTEHVKPLHADHISCIFVLWTCFGGFCESSVSGFSLSHLRVNTLLAAIMCNLHKYSRHRREGNS